MKLLSLRKKIIINISISALLLVISGLTIYYDNHQKESAKIKAAAIESEVSIIKSQYEELERKTIEIKKYQQSWKTISSNRKVIGNIKMDEVNSKLNLVAEKYSIIKPAIRIILPEDLNNGVFNRSTVTVAVSTANLTFEAINDVKALSFISEFINSITGYAIITNLELKKAKKYTDQDLVAISSGKGSGAITARVDFFWYFYKPKTVVEAKETQPKSAEIPPQ